MYLCIYILSQGDVRPSFRNHIITFSNEGTRMNNTLNSSLKRGFDRVFTYFKGLYCRFLQMF